MTPEQRLANAIIMQAVKDYKRAYKLYRHHPDSSVYKADVAHFVRFFTGPWYAVLTEVDGEYLLKRLNEKCEEEMSHGK